MGLTLRNYRTISTIGCDSRRCSPSFRRDLSIFPPSSWTSGSSTPERLVCEFLGVDLSSLWQWRTEIARMFTLTHLYRPFGGPPIPDPMDGEKYFPWTVAQLQAGKLVVLSSLAELPAAADRIGR